MTYRKPGLATLVMIGMAAVILAGCLPVTKPLSSWWRRWARCVFNREVALQFLGGPVPTTEKE